MKMKNARRMETLDKFIIPTKCEYCRGVTDHIIQGGTDNVICPDHGGFTEIMYEPTIGKKNDHEKPRMDLLPMDALLMIAKVMTFGAKKYGERNWEKGIDPQRFRGAILRHDAARETGEQLDPESGFPHVAHKACSALIELALRLRENK